MDEPVTLELVKAYRRSFDDTGSSKSKMVSILDELIRRMELDDADHRASGHDKQVWTDDELKIHMENAMWLTRTVCRSLLALRVAARAMCSFVSSHNTHADGCPQKEVEASAAIPCTCGHNKVLRELEKAIKS